MQMRLLVRVKAMKTRAEFKQTPCISNGRCFKKGVEQNRNLDQNGLGGLGAKQKMLNMIPITNCS